MRQLVVDRDGGCCVCGREDNLHVHHVVAAADGGSNDPQNLQLLCEQCHVAAHRLEGA